MINITKTIHRQLLEKILAVHLSRLEGIVLDIGSKNRRYDKCLNKAAKVIAIDIAPQTKDIIAADARFLPFKDESFDNIICFETIEYIIDVEEALQEAKRVLKKGGSFIFSMPFLNPVHGAKVSGINQQVNNGGVDSLRLTSKGISLIAKRIFSEFEIFTFGGRRSIIVDLLFAPLRSTRLIKYIFIPLYLCVLYWARYFDAKENDFKYPMGYVVVCKKT